MNKTLTIVFGLLTLACFGQKNQSVDLNWKVGKKEKLSYLTVMSEMDTSTIEVNFGGLSKSFADSSDKDLSDAKRYFKKINDSFKNVDLVSTLTSKGNGIIDIVMIANQNKNKELKSDTTDVQQKEIIKMMQEMNQGIMLRGSVYEKGGIHSFWIKSNQKNLVSVFFELPKKSIRIGDSWGLDINLISNDQNFECDSSYKLNKVTLIDIKKVNGENIAVLKYNIVEYVSGNFNTPSFAGITASKTQTMMKFTHHAIAEFSIDKGRWISYDGIMTLVSSGIMTANKKTKFTLIKV